MADLDVEVFREDVDQLSIKLMAVIQESVGAMPYVDRTIIVAAALGNVACGVDAAELVYSAGCTRRLKSVASSWRTDW